MTSLAGNRVFVLALLFTPDGRQVALMRRTRPAWQAGRVNALGGKVAEGETPADAARREVREEAGVDVAEWTEVLVWEDREYRMHVVRAMSSRASMVRTMEDQEVFLADVAALPDEVIGNVRWLVPLRWTRMWRCRSWCAARIPRDRGSPSGPRRGSERCRSFRTSRCTSKHLQSRIVGQPLEKLAIAKPFVLRSFDPPVHGDRGDDRARRAADGQADRARDGWRAVHRHPPR